MIEGWTGSDSGKRDKWRLRRLKKIKTFNLIIIFIILAVLAAILLRLNNINMADLRRAVYEADKTGEITKVEQAATNLRNYVSAHMNTDTGLISLQTIYNDAVAEAVRKANVNIDNEIYKRADRECRSVIWQKGYSAYVQCVAKAVGSTKFNEPKLPDPALFYLSFSAPLLSADLAGVTTILVFIIFIFLAIRVITEVTLNIVVKIKKNHP